MSIIQTIAVIDNGGKRLALVVDEKGRLCGTVTDGDIRRGLLRKISLEDKISQVMQTHPITGGQGESDTQLVAKSKTHSIFEIPIVDSEGKMVDLKIFSTVDQRPKLDNPVCIMAGGFGKRLMPHTKDCPKPMLNVGQAPLLESTIKNLADNGFHNIFISVYHLSQQIIEHLGDGSQWDISLQYLQEDSPLGTAGALSLLPETLPDLPLIVLNGDILTKLNFKELLEFHNHSNTSVTTCVTEYEFQVPYGVIKQEEGRLTAIEEKPSHKFFVNAGIYALNKEIIANMDKNKAVDMPVVLQKYIKENQVGVFPIHEYWLDIGKIDDLEKAQKDFIEEFK